MNRRERIENVFSCLLIVALIALAVWA